MEKEDVELIYSILAGDEAAFSTLVKKIPKECSRASRGGKSEISISLKRLPKTFSYRHIKNLPR